MTRLLTLALLLVALVQSASAQITITRNDFRTLFESSTTTASYEAFSSTGLQAIADRSGPDQTWDFSALAFDAPETATTAPAGPGAPGADAPLLAGATHVVRSTAADTSAYLFVRLTADAFETLGVTAESQSGGAFDGLLFAPAQRTYALPLSFGTTWTSASVLAFSPDVLGFTARQMTRNTVEGWGTLVTPQGSAPALKVRTVLVSIGEIPDLGTFRDSTESISFVTAGTLGASIALDQDGVAYEASYTVVTRETAGDGDAPAGGLNLQLAGANPVRRGAAVEVAFELPAAGPAVVEVYDVLGRRIATLADGTLPADGRAVWQTGTVPAGLYLVRLSAGGRTAMRQVVVTN